jgi:hypothetical protein
MTSQKIFTFPGTPWPQKFCILWRFVAFYLGYPPTTKRAITKPTNNSTTNNIKSRRTTFSLMRRLLQPNHQWRPRDAGCAACLCSSRLCTITTIVRMMECWSEKSYKLDHRHQTVLHAAAGSYQESLKQECRADLSPCYGLSSRPPR